MASFRVANMVLRVCQLVFAVIVMGLIGNMIDDATNGSSSTVNYNMFVPAFTLLTLFYLIPAGIWDKVMMHPGIVFIIDVMNCIFIFCGAVALPAKQHVHSCTNEDYTSTNSITRGSPFPEKRCREGQAATAFLWFLWFTFLLTSIFSGLAMVDKLKGRPARRRGGSAPTMSQV
ncbi:hypothetical protein FQN57_001554 [Myotisia sp. PD_48]|nr:hypothetical protein FQN57_001554 [Myotisia sp. PD_48]